MNLSELCREFGISRETACVWLCRYRTAGHKLDALEARSHRPHHVPDRIPDEASDAPTGPEGSDRAGPRGRR